MVAQARSKFAYFSHFNKHAVISPAVMCVFIRNFIDAVILLMLVAAGYRHAMDYIMPKNNTNYGPNVPSFSLKATASNSGNVPSFSLKATALNSGNVSFVSHAQDKPFGSYLQQTLDFSQFKALFDAVNATTGLLQSRGEAHITVVTPPEFDRVLKPAGITIQEIEDIAQQANIQHSRLCPVCLGRFNGSLPNPAVDADKGRFLLYSLVVEDKFDDLLAIRQDIFNLYRKKGGEGALFQPESFWPHVTIGFDRRDLFIEDGIYKGSNYCYARIHLVK